MKRWLICLICLVTACQKTWAVEWLTDLPTAAQRAASEHKVILLDFTGSDWCGWCMKLKREVFDKPEFADYAKANLIMVEVDFPRSKWLSSAQIAANAELARTYSVRGYPTVILLDANSKKIGKTGYVEGGPKKFIESLEKNGVVSHSSAVADAPAESTPAHNPPAFVPIPPAPPMHYGDLALKAISGAKGHRLALINNETIGIGETAKVKVHDQRVELTVTEIRDDSVVVFMDGKASVLTFAAH